MKILVVRIGRLGDIVMTLPAIHALKIRYPSATFYALTSKDGARLYPSLKLIDADKCVIFWHTWLYRLIDTFKVKAFLKAHAFDKIICFETKSRTQNWLPSDALLLPETDKIEPYPLRLLRLIGESTCSFPYLFLDNCHREKVAHRFKAYAIEANTIVIGFHPSFSGSQKWFGQLDKHHRMWPATHFAALAKQLTDFAKAHGKNVAIVMDLLKEEWPLGEEIVKLSGGTVKITQISTDFLTYLAYLDRLDMLVVANTGVMHLRAGLNKPMIALFSRLHPDDCGPFMEKDKVTILRAEDTISPNLGLASITAEKVYEAMIVSESFQESSI